MWRNVEKTKRDIMPLFYANSSVIVFDTETTGFGSDAKIIQFSGIRFRITDELKLEEDCTLDLYINPEEPLSDKIVEITGITDTILKKAKTESEVFDLIQFFMESADFWSAYNCSFDLRMINQMECRLGKTIAHKKCIDILKLARDLVGRENVEDYKLQTVTTYLFPEFDAQYHSALEDVRATAKCLQSFLDSLKIYQNDMKGKQQAIVEWASYQENPRQRSQKRIKLKLNFGEYGDIFWDVVKKSWSCKSTPKAKKLFQTLDIENLEQQVLNKYAWKYCKGKNDIESLAYEWGKAKKEQAAN